MRVELGTAVTVALLATVFAAAPALAETFYFELQLSGAAGGDQDGAAHGTLSIDSETGRIVWGLYYDGIAAPTAMHIHRGAAGESGGVIIPLNVESKLGDGALTGTVTGELDAVGEILAAPESFYINIHNGDFRGGALRAQLGKRWGRD
jgi:hypothetical protein